MKRSRPPAALASRAKPMISRVPSTLICARLVERQVERDRGGAVHHRAGLLGDRGALGGVHAQAGRGDVAGDGARRARGTATGRARAWPDAVQALLGRGVVGRAHERDHVAVALLEQARQHLHAEEAGGAGQEDGRASRLDLLAHRRDLRAHRVEAAVDVDDLRRDRARGVAEQEVDRLGDRRRVLDVPAAAGPASPTRSARSLKPGMPRAASVRQRAGARRGSRARGAGRGRARGSARSPPARPWPRPSSRRPARRPARRSRARRSPRPPPGTGRRARRPAPSARTPTSGTR